MKRDMQVPARREQSASRLFALYAIASLVPILVLGLVLTAVLQREATARGMAEARSKAALLAHALVEPVLGSTPLSAGLTDLQQEALQTATARTTTSGDVVRFRLRDEHGTVQFSSDGSGLIDAADHDVIEALEGATISELTRLNSDSNDAAPVGDRVVEVYLPVRAVSGEPVVGVLELYQPYAPIERDVSAGMHALYWHLGVGLLALYVVLGVISFSVTRRLRREARAHAHLAHHDVLTGLPNRVLFHTWAQAAVERNRSGSGAVVIALLDLDRFKEVNDSLGHHNGDILLAELGQRLAEQVRGKDLVARLGGDEFGVVLTDITDEAHAHVALQRLASCLEDEIVLRGLPLSIEASIGFALAPEDGDTVERLMQCADVAMYQAKRQHAGTIRYCSDFDEYDAARLSLVAELKRAIERDELVLHYQPKVEAGTGRVCAVEALVRWNHPSRGLLYPDEFLPIAERTGLIEPLTQWVLTCALAETSTWGGLAESLSVSVNVSARDLVRPDFSSSVLASLRDVGVDASRLVLEITETALMSDPDRAAGTVARLNAAGIRVSLDDFGRGQTSLGYLSTLALHELKIDKGFVLGMAASSADAAIVSSVVELGHQLGLVVVAEGVETDSDSRRLAEIGCDILQGYAFAKPAPAADLLAWLLDRHMWEASVHEHTARRAHGVGWAPA